MSLNHVKRRAARTIARTTRKRSLSRGKGGIGGLLARSHGYSGGTWSTHSFYHADALGNVSYLINSSQSMVASYKYDPYGRTISSSGTLASANVMRFSSKLAMDASSMGLYYYGYRFYEPNLQRWVNRDPIGEAGGVNLYGFVANNPVNRVDPRGLASLDECYEAQKKADEAMLYLMANSMTVDAGDWFNYFMLQAIADAICGRPPPPPSPVVQPCPYPNPYQRPPVGGTPENNRTFCERHPVVCATGAVVGAAALVAGAAVLTAGTGGAGAPALAGATAVLVGVVAVGSSP